MPELPETEIIARQIKKELSGKKIANVEIIGTYKVHPTNEQFTKTLKGASIEDAQRIAKVIVIKLSNQHYLTFHLAMTGKLLLKACDYERVKIKFTDGTELRFSDLRMFGYAKVINEQELTELKSKHGPTPFSKDLNKEAFLKRLQKRKTNIKRILLEQDIIAGVGNIYANDALWMSQIHPETITHNLTLDQSEKLLQALREILKEGFEHGGSTIKDFVDLHGTPGTQQNYFRIYGKNGQTCKRCQTQVKMIMISGRSTFFCPTCQTL